MNQDPLAEFARALADEKDGASPAPGATRSRILASVARDSKKRKLRLAWHAPLWVLLLGTTAWASQNAPLRAWVASRLEPANVELEAPAFSATKSIVRRQVEKEASLAPPNEASPLLGARENARAAKKTSTETPSLAAPPVVAASRSRAERDSNIPRTIATIEPPSKGSDEAKSESLARYRRAHDAQFKALDCSSALADYERYVALDPTGSFVPEARYNSALCLVRLERFEEAKQALAPFAAGKFGDYRRVRAAELLEAIAKH